MKRGKFTVAGQLTGVVSAGALFWGLGCSADDETVMIPDTASEENEPAPETSSAANRPAPAQGTQPAEPAQTIEYWPDGVTVNGLSAEVDDRFHGVTMDAQDNVY